MIRKLFLVFVCLLIVFSCVLSVSAESYSPSVSNSPFVPFRVTFKEYGTGNYYGLSSADFGHDLMQYEVVFDNNVSVLAEYAIYGSFPGSYGSELYSLFLTPPSSGSGHSPMRFDSFQVDFAYLVPIYCSYDNLYDLFSFNSAGTTSSGCVVFGLDTSGQLVTATAGQASSSSSSVRTTRLFTDSDARRLVSIFGNGSVIYMVNASLRYQVYMPSTSSQPFAGQVEFITPVGSYESVFNTGYAQLLDIGASQYDAGYEDGNIAGAASMKAEVTAAYNKGLNDSEPIWLAKNRESIFREGYEAGWMWAVENGDASLVVPDLTSWFVGTVDGILSVPLFGTFGLGSILVFCVMLGGVLLLRRFFG